MNHKTLSLVLLGGTLVLGAGNLRADRFVLNQGGEVVGELKNADQSPRENYLVKTTEGALVTLDRWQVSKVVRESSALSQYATIRPRYPDTADGQWELAEWCKKQSLTAQRKTHLERVIELDPDHAKARRALGYAHLDGKWMTQKERMEEDGRVYYSGRWMLPQEVQLLKEKHDVDVKEKEWMQKLARWQGWLVSGRDAATARKNIAEITDPMAVRGLATGLESNSPADVRELFIAPLGKIGNTAALKALAAAAMEDSVEDVRLTCLETLKKHKDAALVDYFVGQLYKKNQTNEKVNRAARALKEIGNPSAIGALINVLFTSHKSKPAGPAPGSMTTSFGGGGGTSGGGIHMNGAPKIVVQVLQNRDVLDALVTLSGGQDYGFDVAAWKAWYAGTHKHDTLDGRRG
jgi:hypothetical protein